MGGLPLKGSSSTVATAESQPNQGSAITTFCAWEDGRIFPDVRYSTWIDGKVKLVVDPYQILERYSHFFVCIIPSANKAAGKYDNSSTDNQIEFYKSEGLTPYSEAKLPITSDVPEGCVIVRENSPITNLFTCLWFNEVDRFTARDQISFSTVRDKIMVKVSWSVNMFLDCERRNFVIQAYHRDLLEHMVPTPPRVARTQNPRVLLGVVRETRNLVQSGIVRSLLSLKRERDRT
ncbi:hypothetical protein LWI28_004252 [Acer negundo]|uniref:TOD1/MUCI70 glycosyltransferase-like domain-containing protein n=1 Tax=Acer negundo TaxID=4023 RepID=A0AAD5NVR7_ACENE|nr:hypothetical protein LWI28_004252 [Acer negundo]